FRTVIPVRIRGFAVRLDIGHPQHATLEHELKSREHRYRAQRGEYLAADERPEYSLGVLEAAILEIATALVGQRGNVEARHVGTHHQRHPDRLIHIELLADTHHRRPLLVDASA